MKIIILFLIIIVCAPISFSQEGSDQQLAQYYYANGDYDKAVSYYQRLFEREGNKFTFNRYFECLVKTENFKEAEKILKKQIEADRTN
jgi:tetratricopeptide (TPR) repeat protein